METLQKFEGELRRPEGIVIAPQMMKKKSSDGSLNSHRQKDVQRVEGIVIGASGGIISNGKKARAAS